LKIAKTFAVAVVHCVILSIKSDLSRRWEQGVIRFILMAGLLGAVTVRAQSIGPEYLTDVWTGDNGLPNSSVTDITQTPDGYLWVGTYNGLVRFDGARFVTYDPANVPALAHARVRRLSVDDQGTLYINTYYGSLTSFRKGVFASEWTGHEEKDPDVTLVSSDSNQVTFLLHRGSLRRRLPSAAAGTGWEDLVPASRAVGTLCVADGRGGIWYRGADRWLWKLTGDTFARVPPEAGLAGTQVDCLVTDARGRLWAATDQGIARQVGVRFEMVTPTNGEPVSDVAALSINKDGSYWAIVNGRVRAARDHRWVREAAALCNVFTGTLSRLGAQPDHRGGVWLHEYQHGLFHVDAAGRVLHFDEALGFPGDRINCFFEDREGDWWAGLDAGGLVRIRERRFQTVTAGSALAAKPAKSVCEDAAGTVWMATLGAGVESWPAETALNIPPPPGDSGMDFAFCVYPDQAGRLWVSAGQEDLYVIDAAGYRRVTPSVHGVKTILADHTGRLWAGTKNGLFERKATGPGVFQLNPSTGRADVRALAEDASGNLWVGSEDGTLFRVTETGTATFHPDEKTNSAQAIWSLWPDADGSVWVGTFRGGLLHFQNGAFTRFGQREGLPDNVIGQILDDGQGNLWLGSHQGIFRVAKQALADYSRAAGKPIPWVAYGRSDGLPSLECSGGYQPAAWRGRDGRLWFATLHGVVSVQPADLHPNLRPPTVVIEDLLLDGHSLASTDESPDSLENPAETGLNHEKPLVIPPGKHQFEFQYTGISLVSSDRVKFRYQLENEDAGWVDAGSRRSVQYGYLPPGKYQFHVIACNNDGVWNNTGDTLKFIVQPHFYQTWSFQVLAGILGVGLVFGIVRQTTLMRLRRKMEQQMEKLERQHVLERERTRIAKDIHDDLGASLTLIAVLGDLAKKEKTGDRIEKMSGMARQAVKSLDEIVWAVNPRNDTLAHLIDYAGQFATDYLRDAGIRCLLDFPEQSPVREVPANVRHNLFLVVKEALQNIVKHARATEVWLRITTSPQSLKIVVEDNGCGFDQPPENALADGLRNMRQRLAEIQAYCQIQSRPGSGTIITIELSWPPT
jgi:signal transduction histidine kinase/ligand-binding sensor domain-containing protein